MKSFALAGVERQRLQVGLEIRDRLALQHVEQALLLLRIEPGVVRERAEDTDVAEIDRDVLEPDGVQRRDHQADDFDIGADRRAAENLGADLQRRAARGRAVADRVQQVAAVAKARDPVAARIVGEQVRVDARDLRRHVRAHAHLAARQLVDEDESLALERVRGAGQQRIHVFDDRRHDQLVAPAAKNVENVVAQGFDRLRVGRQGFLHPVGQQPSIRRAVGHG